MRVWMVALLGAAMAEAQTTSLKTTVPLVVAPTTITDRAGHYIYGLTAADLLLFDNNVPRQIQVDELTSPIELVIAIQATQETWAALDKIQKVGSMIQPLVAGARGEVAVICYGDTVKVEQEFTSDPAALVAVFQRIKAGSHGSAHPIEAVSQALDLLATRGNNRKVIIVIGETRDRGSKTPLEQVVSRAQHNNVTVYYITYSRFLTPFTARWEEVCDADGNNCRPRDPEWGGANLAVVFSEIHAHTKTNLADAFARYTGGRKVSFLKQKGLEQVIESLGEEIHNQYMLTFTPPPSDPGEFHQIRVEVRDRPDLRARTRAGYWTVPQ